MNSHTCSYDTHMHTCTTRDDLFHGKWRVIASLLLFPFIDLFAPSDDLLKFYIFFFVLWWFFSFFLLHIYVVWRPQRHLLFYYLCFLLVIDLCNRAKCFYWRCFVLCLCWLLIVRLFFIVLLYKIFVPIQLPASQYYFVCRRHCYFR